MTFLGVALMIFDLFTLSVMLRICTCDICCAQVMILFLSYFRVEPMLFLSQKYFLIKFPAFHI